MHKNAIKKFDVLMLPNKNVEISIVCVRATINYAENINYGNSSIFKILTYKIEIATKD